MTAVDYGLACLELEAGDSGIRSLVSVQGSLAMFAIWRFGSEEQKQEWLPRMAAGRGDRLLRPHRARPRLRPRRACAPAPAATAPTGSSTARRCGSPTARIADVAVVWANAGEDGGIRGFVVPTDTPGFAAHEINHKLSLRASVTSELTFEDVRLPADAVLPDVTGLKGPLSCLTEARFGIVWGALGAARASPRGGPPLRHGPRAVRQADRGLPADPGQARRHGGRAAPRPAARAAPRPAQGRRGLRPEQVSVGKLNNVREAIEIAARRARSSAPTASRWSTR